MGRPADCRGLVSEGLIDAQTALQRLAAIDLESVTRTRLERGADEIPIATGVLILEGPRPDCAPRPLFGRTQLQFGAG